MEQDNYIACEVCDTLHHKHHLTGLASARCSRCGTTLYRHVGLRSADRELAIAFAALITFLIANAFPIVELEANGITTRTTLIGAVLNLIDGDRTLIAFMVATVTIAFPFVEMMALIYLLMPLRLGRKPPGFDLILRTIQAVRPWGMIEVFMLGVLITVVKMTSLARVIPEIAMFAFGALTFLIAALVSFDPRDLWDLADDTIVRITALRLHAARGGVSHEPTMATATAGVPVPAQAPQGSAATRDASHPPRRPQSTPEADMTTSSTPGDSSTPRPGIGPDSQPAATADATTAREPGSKTSQPAPAAPHTYLTAARCGLVSCHSCGLLNRHVPGAEKEVCRRCGATLHSRKPDSLSRTWALLISAAIMYLPANLLPVMHTSSIFGAEDDTIMSGIVYFWTSGSWPLAIIVFIASFMVPMLKLIVLAILAGTAQAGSRWRPIQRTRLYRLVEFIGRWSMLDVFVVTLTVALVHFQSLATIYAGPGAVAFGLVVVLTMFASHQFDPRLIWDTIENSGQHHD